MTPSVGRIVHYVSYGTPGGEYGKECRAAVVTAVRDQEGELDLAVLNPEGMFFNREVEFSDGAETPGSADCPRTDTHGSPFRYCACGWREATLVGGTWHWPERIE